MQLSNMKKSLFVFLILITFQTVFSQQKPGSAQKNRNSSIDSIQNIDYKNLIHQEDIIVVDHTKQKNICNWRKSFIN